MLASISPLGERARSSRWGVTVTAYVLGSVLGGAALGAARGRAGLAAAAVVARLPWPPASSSRRCCSPGCSWTRGRPGCGCPRGAARSTRRGSTRYRGWVYGAGLRRAARPGRGHHHDQRHRLRHRAALRPVRQPARGAGAGRAVRPGPRAARRSAWPASTTARRCTACSTGWSAGHRAPTGWRGPAWPRGPRRWSRAAACAEELTAMVSEVRARGARPSRLGHPDLPPGRHPAPGRSPTRCCTPAPARCRPSGATSAAASSRCSAPRTCSSPWSSYGAERGRPGPVRDAGHAAAGALPVRPGPVAATLPGRARRSTSSPTAAGPSACSWSWAATPAGWRWCRGPRRWSAPSPSPTGPRMLPGGPMP